MRPKLLDLFCGGGGAAVGYYRAGFDVTGVDIKPQPHYPFEFHLGDALSFPLEGFDFIHASPPCQGYSHMTQRWKYHPRRTVLNHPRLIAPVRERLVASGAWYVIENVEGAAPDMRTTLRLHGGHFGLGVHRPRLFESNVVILAPKATIVGDLIGVYGRAPDGGVVNTRATGTIHYRARNLQEGQAAMGIDWLPWTALKEAIPPDYTEFIGRQLIRLSGAAPVKSSAAV